jgi:hypothetical protein
MYEEILEAWDTYFDRTNYNVVPRNLLIYQQCLVDGYDHYRQGHREQRRLLTDDFFIQKLSASLAKTPRYDSLMLTESHEHLRDYNPGPGGKTRDLTWFRQYIKLPISWERIEELGAELVLVRILVGLPVALHRAGIKLRKLQLNCFL